MQRDHVLVVYAKRRKILVDLCSILPGDIRGVLRFSEDVAADVKERLKTVDFPHEYHYDVLGEFAERQAAQGRLFAFGLAAALGILLLLQTCSGSWRVATFSFLTGLQSPGASSVLRG